MDIMTRNMSYIDSSSTVKLPSISSLLGGPTPTNLGLGLSSYDVHTGKYTQNGFNYHRSQESLPPLYELPVPPTHHMNRALPSLDTSDKGPSTMVSMLPSPSTTDSSAELVMTPDCSRTTSASGSPSSSPRIRRETIRKSTYRVKKHSTRGSVHPAGPTSQCNTCERPCTERSHQKNLSKTNKERRSRNNQSRSLQFMEDLLRYNSGWELSQQSGGNGNSAGLRANKINVMNGGAALLDRLLADGRRHAILEGREAEWLAANCAVIEAAICFPGTLASEMATTTTATSLSSASSTSSVNGDEDLGCYHKGNAKKCEVHGTPDWRDCRYEGRAKRWGHANEELRQVVRMRGARR